MRWVGEEGRFSSISVAAEDGVSQQQVADSIDETLEAADASGVEVVTGTEITEETQSDIKQSLSFITTFFLVFAVIALVVGTFVIYNSFSIIVAQRTREMALLRAIGARRRQVRRAVLVEAVIVGLVGATVGFVDRAGRGHAAGLGAGGARRRAGHRADVGRGGDRHRRHRDRGVGPAPGVAGVPRAAARRHARGRGRPHGPVADPVRRRTRRPGRRPRRRRRRRHGRHGRDRGPGRRAGVPRPRPGLPRAGATGEPRHRRAGASGSGVPPGASPATTPAATRGARRPPRRR